MEEHILTLTYADISELAKSPMPEEVAMRCRLNRAGFKFEDDGKPSLILNLDPKPLGVFHSSMNDVDRTVTFTQQIQLPRTNGATK